MMKALAETEAEAGRPDLGLANIEMQLAAIERTGQRWFLAELHRARGEILRQVWVRRCACGIIRLRARDRNRPQPAGKRVRASCRQKPRASVVGERQAPSGS